MAVPVLPEQIRSTIASPSATFCDKFFNLFRISRYVYDIFSFFVSDSGKLTPAGAAFICQLNCGGSGTGPGTGELTAPTIQASDGAFLGKVQITWPAVAGATGYDVYRNLTDDSSGAGMIGSTTTLTFDDTTAAQGQVFFYWVKAKNLTVFSAFSNSDSGFAATALAAITDLGATQGYGGYVNVSALVTTGVIHLVWTPPVGAERYDIYRSLPNDNTFGTAVKIATDRVPFDNSASQSTGPQPTFIDNGGELVYIDTSAPTRFDTFYYWVISKAGSGASLSPQSNGAAGWAIGDGSGATPMADGEILNSGSTAFDVPSGAVRAFILLFGSGAGGAGAAATYGGGGGGGPAVVQGKYAIMSGKVKVVSAPETDTGRANTSTNGANASSTTFQYASDGTTYATLMTVAAAAGGVYSATGGGAGGASSTGSVAGGVTDSLIRNGRAGGNAMGSKGGRSGYFFGSTRWPPAHFNVFDPGGWLGDGSSTGGSPAGSGSNAHPAGGVLTYGGEGKRGRAIVYFYAA